MISNIKKQYNILKHINFDEWIFILLLIKLWIIIKRQIKTLLKIKKGVNVNCNNLQVFVIFILKVF